MSSLAFDTHKFVTDLTKAGMKTELAEVLATHYAGLVNDRLATKDDLQILRMELKGDMAALEERLNGRIIATQLAGVLATCAIIGFLMLLLQTP